MSLNYMHFFGLAAAAAALLVATGCQAGLGDQSQLDQKSPIKTYESVWSGEQDARGKNRGPFQLRYRLEEYSNREFRLFAYAAANVLAVGEWKIELVSRNNLKIIGLADELERTDSERFRQIARQRIDFSDPERKLSSIYVRVEGVIDRQLASMTFEVPIGL